jgi:hypothetical protein
MIKSKSIRESTLTRIILASVASILLTLTILAVTTVAPVTAETYYQRDDYGRYDDGSIEPVQFRFYSVATSWSNAFKDGAAEWNIYWAAEVLPGCFSETTWWPDPEINVIDEDLAAGVYAQTTYSLDGDNTYSGNEVTTCFNTDYIATLSAADKEKVAAHEQGHAWGLKNGPSGVMDGELPSSLPSLEAAEAVWYIYN